MSPTSDPSSRNAGTIHKQFDCERTTPGACDVWCAQGVDMLSDLPAANKQRVARAMEIHTFPKGDPILTEGEEGDKCAARGLSSH